ncbi:hypothetical protein B447_09903 [Thauera sp. 27]|uniref:hypothetical protein n=1 Tax=Thauera sp. 27 TaxID=305700 RepID=UPI0002CF26AA|nr:hypothetical protein [Thauera sp. 27]ENO80991.1 hypothetical protein B447_09903 [Thauera sp. 27]
MGSAVSNFFESLNKEEAKLVPRLAGDRLGIQLRCALSELDWYYYNITRTQEPTFEQQEHYYILQLGVVRLIHLALSSRPSFDVPVVSFPRRPELSKAVLELASALGMIQHGRRIAQYVAMGVGEISEGEQGEFNVMLPEKLVNSSGHEQDVLEGFTSESKKRFERLMQVEPIRKLEREVGEKLSALVRPWGTHFIGYDADPLLDDYFFGLAYHSIQLQEGFDSFHYALRFGGVRYQHYVLALTFLLSNSMRHERFAEALVNKDGSIRLENVLTITSDVEPFIADLREAVNYFGSAYDDFEELGVDEARTVFDVLSCGRHSLELVSAPGSPTPLIVQCSEQGFIRCLSGARSEPVRYMLEALRLRFQKDYDRNQCSREVSLQKAVKRILGASFNGLEFIENLKVKSDGKMLTDIDLVVIERITGIILLCQLKHQDLYGFNLHAERTRGGRLVEQVDGWLQTVDSWLQSVGQEGFRGALRLRATIPDLQIYRMVIARHYAHQLKDIALLRKALYANWPQLLLATEIASRESAERGLIELVERIVEIPNLQSAYEHQPESRAKWTVGGLTFSTFQAGC